MERNDSPVGNERRKPDTIEALGPSFAPQVSDHRPDQTSDSISSLQAEFRSDPATEPVEMRRSNVAPLFNDTVDSDNGGITPVNHSDGSFNNLSDGSFDSNLGPLDYSNPLIGPDRFHRMRPGMALSQHRTNLDGFNYFANATAHDPMLGSEADQLPVFSQMTPSHHVAGPFTMGSRAGNGLTSQATRCIGLSLPDYHDHRSSAVARPPQASRDQQFSGPESVETEEPLLELDELTEINSTFARQPTERQLGINPSVDRGYQLGHFHSSSLQPVPRSAFANLGFVNRSEQLQNRSRNLPQVPSAGRYWQELAYDHDQTMQYPEQRGMPNVQRFLPSHASFQNQTLDTLGDIRDMQRAYPIYSTSQLQRSAERGMRADAHGQFVGHRVEEMDVRDRSLQNQRVSRLRHASLRHDLSEDQPAVDDDTSPSSLRVISSIPPAYAQWRPFDYARYGNRLLVEPETENHAARPSGFARVEWRSRPSSCNDRSGRTVGGEIRLGSAFDTRLPDSADDDRHTLQGNRNNLGPRSWPQQDNYRGGRASSYFSDATQRQQSFYDDEGESRNGNMSNQPFLPPRYEDEESYYSDDGEVSYATHMEGGSSLNGEWFDTATQCSSNMISDYDDREYQDDQERAKRRKTTSGYTHQPTITHKASAPKLAPQVGSGRTSPYRRTRGSDGECNERGFGGQRKWWSRITRKGRLEVRRKNRDPWSMTLSCLGSASIADNLVVKAVYHYQIRETLFEAAGKWGNSYGRTMLLCQLRFADRYSSSSC